MSQTSFKGNASSAEEKCLSRLAWTNIEDNVTTSKMCGLIWDGFNCWAPAVPGTTAFLDCPAAKGMDVTKQASRICDAATSQWLGRDGQPDERGWTNYTACFTPEMLDLIKRLYSGSETEATMKIDVAWRTRVLEIFGLSLSLLALLVSLVVFGYFRSLRNPRTRLHRHLFIAMVIQVTVRLTLYIDQFVVRSADLLEEGDGSQVSTKGIDNTPGLCEAAYICLEYARTAMFMWMFVEGIYLHNMITVTVFEEKLSPVYPFLGWILPIPLTFSWAVITATFYGTATCWWGYNFTVYFWILEGPRLAVLLVNLTFLLNILRVLVTKLRQSYSSETHQVRKAVKAALVLLPLLGLTNILNMLDAPLEKSAWEFALWSYTTHALTSSQGFILACLYCFGNGEVQQALKKYVRYNMCGDGGQWNPGNKWSIGRGGTIVDDPNQVELHHDESRTGALQTPAINIISETPPPTHSSPASNWKWSEWRMTKKRQWSWAAAVKGSEIVGGHPWPIPMTSLAAPNPTMVQ